MDHLVMECVEAQSAATAPASRCRSSARTPHGKAGELVAELVKDPDKQVRRAVDGFRQVVERGGLVGADHAYRTCGPGSCRGRRSSQTRH